MSKLINILRGQLSLLCAVGVLGYVEYRMARKGKVVSVRIGETNVFVRKGTPDLSVAVSCLTGEFKELEGILSKNFDGVIVDAGGYIGTAALALSKMYPRACVYTIEPSMQNYEMLLRNTSGSENIKPIHGALGARGTGKAVLKNRKTGEWGFTIVDTPADCESPVIMHDISIYTLSSIVSDVSQIGILKLDIEGAEMEIIQNDSKNLEKIKAIFVELHDRIVPGCSHAFERFSSNRNVKKVQGEKKLSVRVD